MTRIYYLMFLFILPCVTTTPTTLRDLSGKMFIFPEKSSTAHVKLNLNQDLSSLTALTVCHRSFSDLVRDHSLFSMSTPSKSNAFLNYVSFGPRFSLTVQNHDIYYEQFFYAPNTWHSICTTWDSATGLVHFWQNGQPLTYKYATEIAITEKPVIILGQEQDNYGDGFRENQSFEGMMTDVHMWNYVISPSEIHKFMSGEHLTKGNLLNWADLDYEIKGRVFIGNTENMLP